MKTKNAEIKTKQEAIDRIIGGEEFLHKECLFHYNEDFIKLGQSPFRVCFEESNSEIQSDLWGEFEQWERELHWYEQLEKPRLCWVGDTTTVLIDSITRSPTNGDGFVDINGDFYAEARPVRPDELIGGRNEKS